MTTTSTAFRLLTQPKLFAFASWRRLRKHQAKHGVVAVGEAVSGRYHSNLQRTRHVAPHEVGSMAGSGEGGYVSSVSALPTPGHFRISAHKGGYDTPPVAHLDYVKQGGAHVLHTLSVHPQHAGAAHHVMADAKSVALLAGRALAGTPTRAPWPKPPRPAHAARPTLTGPSASKRAFAQKALAPYGGRQPLPPTVSNRHLARKNLQQAIDRRAALQRSAPAGVAFHAGRAVGMAKRAWRYLTTHQESRPASADTMRIYGFVPKDWKAKTARKNITTAKKPVDKKQWWKYLTKEERAGHDKRAAFWESLQMLATHTGAYEKLVRKLKTRPGVKNPWALAHKILGEDDNPAAQAHRWLDTNSAKHWAGSSFPQAWHHTYNALKGFITQGEARDFHKATAAKARSKTNRRLHLLAAYAHNILAKRVGESKLPLSAIHAHYKSKLGAWRDPDSHATEKAHLNALHAAERGSRAVTRKQLRHYATLKPDSGAHPKERLRAKQSLRRLEKVGGVFSRMADVHHNLRLAFNTRREDSLDPSEWGDPEKFPSYRNRRESVTVTPVLCEAAASPLHDLSERLNALQHLLSLQEARPSRATQARRIRKEDASLAKSSSALSRVAFETSHEAGQAFKANPNAKDAEERQVNAARLHTKAANAAGRVGLTDLAKHHRGIAAAHYKLVGITNPTHHAAMALQPRAKKSFEPATQSRAAPRTPKPPKPWKLARVQQFFQRLHKRGNPNIVTKAELVKKGGEKRTMHVAFGHVYPKKAGSKGMGYNPSEKGLLLAHDVEADAPRMMNMAGLKGFTHKGHTRYVKDSLFRIYGLVEATA